MAKDAKAKDQKPHDILAARKAARAKAREEVESAPSIQELLKHADAVDTNVADEDYQRDLAAAQLKLAEAGIGTTAAKPAKNTGKADKQAQSAAQTSTGAPWANNGGSTDGKK